jgi:hypothetical protein
MSMRIPGSGGAGQKGDWYAPPRKTPVEAAQEIREASATEASAPAPPASLTPQDFDAAMRHRANAAMAKTLDQPVETPQPDRRDPDPARKNPGGFDQLTTSLRNAALHRDAAGPASAPSAPTAAHTPLAAEQPGPQHVLDAIAAYKRNSSLPPTGGPQ